MKKWILPLLIKFSFLILNSSYAQPTIEWQKCLGGTGWEQAYSVQQTSDGGYVVGGVSWLSNDGDVSGNHGDNDYWVIKLDGSVNMQWQKCFGGTDHDYAQYVQQTTDGGFVVTGQSESNDGDVTGNHGMLDYWVVKLDGSGNLQWQKSLGGTDYDFAYSIQQTADGGYVVAGFSYSNNGDVSGNHGGADFWIVKLDSSGNIQWQKCFGGPGLDEAFSVQQTSDGGYVVAGASSSNNGDVSGNHGSYDFWVIKIDVSGNIQWQKSLGGTNEDAAHSIRQIADGGYVVAGSSYSNDGDVTGNHGGGDFWVVKLDGGGNLQWQKSLGGTWIDWAFSVQQTSEGGYVVVGASSSNDGDVTGNHGIDDYWVVKLDGSGNLQWQKCLGGTYYDEAFSIQQTADGGYVVAGMARSNNGDVTGNHGNDDFWVVKLSPFVSLEESNSSITSTIFPNPFSTAATISFGKQVHGATFTLYNLLGEVVTETTNIKGDSFQINRGTIPGGVYFYNVKDVPAGQAGEGKSIASGKVVVL